MPAITVYTDPLKPGRAQMPTFVVGDDPNWSINFNNGTTPWNPEGVYVKIGYIKGLADGTYNSAFWLTDRLNFRYIASFGITSSVPATPTWDANPPAVLGTGGCWLVRGEVPATGQVRKIYVVNPGTNFSGTPTVVIDESPIGRSAAAITGIISSGSGDISGPLISDHGFGYITAPGGSAQGGGATDSGAVSSTIAGGRVATVTVVNAGNGYTSNPSIGFTAPVGQHATATATISSGTLAVAGATVVSGGSGYTSAPTVNLSGGGGTSAAFTATIAASSWGVKLASYSGGSGYTSTLPSISVTGGGGSGATIGAAVTNPADGVWATTVTTGSAGSGYILPPTVSFTGGGGSGAAGYANMFNRTVQSVTMTSPGTGYTSPPTVVFTPVSGGSGAAATCVLGTGGLSLWVENPGSGYTSVPTVNISGGGGTGASMTLALIGSPVVSLSLGAGGSGYTSPPTVSFSGGGGTGASANAYLTGGSTGAGLASVTVTNPGFGYLATPKVALVPNEGATVAVAGIETNSVCFISNQAPLNVIGGVRMVPWSRGRYNSSGNEVYDDALIEIRPRLIVNPTFTLGGDNLTWSATFDPVSQFVQSVLNFRSTCVVDFEVFGEGRCLLSSKLAIQAG